MRFKKGVPKSTPFHALEHSFELEGIPQLKSTDESDTSVPLDDDTMKAVHCPIQILRRQFLTARTIAIQICGVRLEGLG